MVLLELIKQWVHDYPDDRILLAVRRPAKQLSGHCAIPRGVDLIQTRLRVHPLINAIELPAIARRHKMDAILAFNFASIATNGVVFMHDAMYQSNPEWFTLLERAYFALEPRLARRTRSVVATSTTEKNRIAKFNQHLRRIVESGLSISTTLEDAEPCDPGLGIASSSFALCVGRLNVRKNLDMTIRGVKKSGVLSRDFPLVVIGEPSGRMSESETFATAVAEKLIIAAGRLTEGELKWLYLNCRIFICLSLDEGYGLPPVEAAIFGAPVLVSDIPVFRETVGEYGIFVDPTDEDAIAAATSGMLAQPRRQETYGRRHDWGSVCNSVRSELLMCAGGS